MRQTVIKPSDVPRLPASLLRLDLRDVANEAAAVVAAARAEAATIVAAATAQAEAMAARVAAEQAEVARLRQAAAESGRAAGLEAGRIAGAAEGRTAGLDEARQAFEKANAPLLAALRGLLDELGRRRESILAAARRDVLVLAAALAERVLGRAVSVDPERVQESVARALSAVGAATTVTLRVNPADAELVARFVPQFAPAATAAAVHVEADLSIARGGALAVTSHGEIDATLGTQLDRIAHELVDGWRDRAAELGASPPSSGSHP